MFGNPRLPKSRRLRKSYIFIDHKKYSWYKISMDKKFVSFSRPKDKSLEAYKAWIKELAFRMSGKNDDSMTEEKWVERWKEFWGEKPEKGS